MDAPTILVTVCLGVTSWACHLIVQLKSDMSEVKYKVATLSLALEKLTFRMGEEEKKTTNQR